MKNKQTLMKRVILLCISIILTIFVVSFVPFGDAASMKFYILITHLL